MRPKTLYEIINACEPVIIKQKLKVDVASLVVLLNLRARDAKDVVIGLSKLQSTLPGTFVTGLITEFFEFDIFRTMARFNVYKTDNQTFSQILKSFGNKRIPYAIVYSRSGIPVFNDFFDLNGGLQLPEEILQSQKASRTNSRVKNRAQESSKILTLSQIVDNQSSSKTLQVSQNNLLFWLEKLQNAQNASLVQDARFGLTHTIDDIVKQLTLVKETEQKSVGGELVYKLCPTGLTGRVLLPRALLLAEKCSNTTINLVVSRHQHIQQLQQLLTDLNVSITDIKIYVDENEEIKDGHMYIFDQYGVLAFEGDIKTLKWPNEQLDEVIDKLQMQQIDLLAPDTFSNTTFNQKANEQLRYISRESTNLVSSQLQVNDLQFTNKIIDNDNKGDNSLQKSGTLPLNLLQKNQQISSLSNQSIRNYFDRSAKVEGFFTYCVELTPGTAAPQQEFPQQMTSLKRTFKPSRERQTMFVIRIYRYTSREMFNRFALDPNVKKYRQYDRYQIYFNINVPFHERKEDVEFVKNRRGKIILKHRGQEIPPIGPATSHEIESFEQLYRVEAQLLNLVRLSENAFDRDNPLFRGGKPVKSSVLFSNNAKNLSVRDQQIVDLVLYTETVTFEYSYKVECGREKESDEIDNQEIDALLAGMKNHSLRTKNSMAAYNSKNAYIELWVGQNLLLPHRHRIIIEPESEDVAQLIVSVRRRDVRSTVPEQRAYCLIPVATYLALSDRWVIVEFLYDPSGHTVEVRAHGQQGMYVIPQINRQLVDQYITMLNNFPSYFAEEVVEQTSLAKLEARIVKKESQLLKSQASAVSISENTIELPQLRERQSSLLKSDTEMLESLEKQLSETKMDGLEPNALFQSENSKNIIKRNFRVLPGIGLVNVIAVSYAIKIERDFVRETYSDEETLSWRNEPKHGERLIYEFTAKSASSMQSHIVVIFEKSLYFKDEKEEIRADVSRKRYSIPLAQDQDGRYRRSQKLLAMAEGEDFWLEAPGLAVKKVNMMQQLQLGLETGNVEGSLIRNSMTAQQ